MKHYFQNGTVRSKMEQHLSNFIYTFNNYVNGPTVTAGHGFYRKELIVPEDF